MKRLLPAALLVVCGFVLIIVCLPDKTGPTTNNNPTNNFSIGAAPANAGDGQVEEKKPRDGHFEVKGSFSVSVDESQAFTRPVPSTNATPPVAE